MVKNLTLTCLTVLSRVHVQYLHPDAKIHPGANVAHEHGLKCLSITSSFGKSEDQPHFQRNSVIDMPATKAVGCSF